MSDGTKKRSYATMAGENKSHSRQPGANHVVSNHNNTDDHSNETHTTERQHEGPTNPTTNNNLQLNTAAPLSASGNDTIEHGHGDNEAEGLGDDATVDEQHEDAAVGEEGEEADEGNQSENESDSEEHESDGATEGQESNEEDEEMEEEEEEEEEEVDPDDVSTYHPTFPASDHGASNWSTILDTLLILFPGC
jgi:hypothetical protein